ncbi:MULTISPECIES: GMC oxidoreductase [Gordonia]|nr:MULTISPECIES: GMC oxidoreductase [Gordonia]UPW14370.1 GMC oxidoreductase [Gordonia amicalis]
MITSAQRVTSSSSPASSLRVVDTSVMPTLPSGHTNAPTMMLAHRGAEILSRGA